MTIETLQIEVDGMSIGNWTVADAKARFSELIEQAQSKGPQTITKHGRTAAVVVSAEEWERKTKRTGNLAEFFATSPLRDSGVEIKRRRSEEHTSELQSLMRKSYADFCMKKKTQKLPTSKQNKE